MNNVRHAFTIDLEDWYQGVELPIGRWKDCAPRIEIGARRILDFLDLHRTKATFFALGAVVKKHPRLVKEIFLRGHELGVHGFSHEKVYDLTPAQFREEARSTKRLVEDLTGGAVRCFRAPFFTIIARTLWALDVLAEEGYVIDCSISPVKTWRYGIRTCPREIVRLAPCGLIEFPVCTFRLCGRDLGIGGAYFRIFPYWLTRRAFLGMERAGKPCMFYGHPWEYDPNHPVIDMDWRAKATHYARLDRMLPNTLRLLEEFDFAPVSDVVEEYGRANPVRTLCTDILQD